MVAFNAADLERLRACYTDDAVLMAPGQDSLTGPSAIIEQMWAPLFENFEVHGELPPTEIECRGDWGFVRGHYELTLELDRWLTAEGRLNRGVGPDEKSCLPSSSNNPAL